MYPAEEPVHVAKSAALTSVRPVRQPLLRSAADSDSAPAVVTARGGGQRTPQLGQCLAVMRNGDTSSSAGNNQGIRDHTRCKFVVCVTSKS